MEVISKIIYSLVISMAMFLVIRRLYDSVSNKLAIRNNERNINYINTLLADNDLEETERHDLTEVKKVIAHENRVRKGEVKLKSGWRPD